MRKGQVFFICCILALSTGFAGEGFGQDQAETRSGCLMTGSTSGTFVLVDELTGRRLTVTGPDLARFATDSGRRVNLTGTLVRQDNADVFQATKVEQTADNCGPMPFSMEGLKDDVGRFRVGVRGGLAVDPELVVIGAQVQLGPVVRSLWFRPTTEFGFGEVTKVYSINGDLVYFLPFSGQGSNPQTRWNTYVGGGPSVTVLRRDFEGFPNQPIDVDDDWDSEVGLNFVAGALQSNGLFLELRASAYSTPDVRLYIGFTFR